MVHSFRHTVSLWVHQTVSGDFFIRPKVAGLNKYQYPLPAEVVEALRRIPDVELMPYRHLELTREMIPYEFEAVRLEPFLQRGGFLMIKGNLEKIKNSLLEGNGVIVSEVFSNQTGLTVGDRYRVTLGEVNLDLPVLGVFRDYRTRGGVVYMSLDRFQEITADRDWSGVRFFFKGNHGDSKKAADWLRGEIFKCCGHKHPLDMASGVELRGEILDIFDQTFAVTTVLLLIALLVAGLGITTTLTVLVLERIRQLNTLSAVGASDRQIRSMIFWEALLMVLAGEAIGLICGFFMSYFLIYVINLESFGWTFLYRVNWIDLAIAMPSILATALLAALPAVRVVLRSSPALVLKEL
jgi:putative ABC transport system permease protein